MGRVMLRVVPGKEGCYLSGTGCQWICPPFILGLMFTYSSLWLSAASISFVFLCTLHLCFRECLVTDGTDI